MATQTITGTQSPVARTRTLRRDAWWGQPLITALVLLVFVAYSTWAAFAGKDFFYNRAGHGAPYISPFYSPCIAKICGREANLDLFPMMPWSPALIVLVFPLLFRATCYYYRKAYYRSIYLAPPACAVSEPHRRYTGESRFPLIVQNTHRFWLYFALIFNVMLTWDAIDSYHGPAGWGYVGVGSLVLSVNAILLWLYTLSCHSCRHAVGGRLNHFSRHPIRYGFWTFVSRLNGRHMLFAWMSLIWVAVADLYVRLCAANWITDPRLLH
jgi:hypothetical protein